MAQIYGYILGDICIKILHKTMWWTSGAVKTAWIWWSIIKTRTVFPSKNLFWKVKFAIKSIYLAGDIEGFFLSWLYKCCDALYAWTTKETWLVIIYWLLTRSWIPMQKAQCDPYAHPGVYSPSNSNICI